MKKYLFPLLLISSLAHAEIEVVGPFGSLNNTDPSYVIPANMAQDLLNVDTSDQLKSIKKRRGYGTAFTLTNSTSPVHGVYYFYDTDGSDVALAFNDRNVNRSISGASMSVIFSTATNGATWQCTDSAGFAYCANTGRDGIFKIDAVSISLLSGFTSTGTMVTVTPERLVQSGFSTDPNIILFSAANDFTNWTLGGNPTSPIQFTITSPGSGVKCIAYAHGRVYWWKDNSFGYILEGATQADWRVVTIDPGLGSINNTFIYREEILYFQANDGHFYAYDGSDLVKLSKDIQETIDETQGRASSSWLQTTAADFGAGSSTSTVIVDTTTVPGTITLSTTSTPWNVQSQPNGTSNNNVADECTGPYYLSQSFLPTMSYILTRVDLSMFDNQGSIGAYGSFQVKISSDNGSNRPGTVLVSTTLASNISSPIAYYSHYFTPTSLTSGTTYWIQLIPTGSCVYATDGIDWVGTTSGGDTFCHANTCVGNFPRNYLVYGTTYAVSGTWQSQIKNASSLSAWDSFEATTLDNGGSHDFYIRASANSFTVNSSTPGWTAVTPGNIPTVSTGAYFQIRDVITSGSNRSVSPILYDFTQNWFEGGASDKTYAIYFNNSNWWAVASGEGASANNKILKFDLINPGWYIYDIPMAGMYVRSEGLYFGSVSVGKVFKFGDVDADNGSAINAYWKSKDFFGSSPFLEKNYTRLSTVHPAISNSTMTVTYTIDGSSATAYNVPLTWGNSSFISRNVNLPQGRNGKTINIKFGNNAIDQSFEVFGGQIEYTSKPWVPTQ